MKRALLTAVMMMIAVGPVVGQTADPASTMAFQKGPLGFTPTLAIPALGVDSNVFNESVNPKSDFTVNVQPDIQALLRAGRARVSLREQVNFLYYRQYESQRAINTNGALRLQILMAKAAPYVGAALVRTNDRPNSEIEVRAQHRTTTITGGLNVQLSGKTRVDIGADRDSITFDEGATFHGEQLNNLDRETQTYRALVQHNLSGPTALTLSASRLEERFTESYRDAISTRLLPGVLFSPFALISGRAEVGVIWYEPTTPTIQPVTGAIARVDLGYVLRGVTRLSVQVSRDIMPSIDSIQTYFVQTGIVGSVTHRVSERWELNTSASRQRLVHGGILSTSAAALSDPGDIVRNYGASVGFHFNRGFRLGCRADYVDRSSVIPANQYHSLRLMNFLNYGFQGL